MRKPILIATVLAMVVMWARLAAANPIFTEGFEAGLGNWTIYGSGTWSTTTLGHSGLGLTDSAVGNYSSNANYVALKTTPFSLAASTAASPPSLSFWHRYVTEPLRDWAYVEVSTDGSTWEQLGLPFSGTSNSWTKVNLSLAAYVGQPTMYLLFVFTSNESVTYDGWTIDDVAIDDGIKTVVVSSPQPSSFWAGGSTHDVTWTYDGSLAGAASFRVDYSTDGGATFGGVIASSVAIASEGTVRWTVPAAMDSTATVVRVQVLSGSGAVLGYGISGTFLLDSTPPGIPVLTTPANDHCAPPNPSFWWSSAAGATSYTLTVTPTSGAPLVVAGLTSRSYSSMGPLSAADSPYLWSVTAYDAAGNSTTSASRTFRVDGGTPAPFALVSPAVGAWSRRSVPFTWTASSDSGCSESITYRLYIDGIACGTTTSTSMVPTCQPGDGDRLWAVQAEDASGNATWCTEAPTGLSSGRVVRLDDTPPSGVTLVSPTADVLLTGSGQTFTWSAGADAGSGVATYQLYMNAQPVGTAGSALSAVWPVTPVDGMYFWHVRVTDVAGNEWNTPDRNFRVDNGAPTSFSLASPADDSCTTQASPNLCWNSASDAGGIASYQLIIDGVPNAAASQTCLTPLTPLGEGLHTWTVRATDFGGHTTVSSQTRNLRVDWTAPVAPGLASPADGVTVASPTPILAWNAATDAGGIERYDVYIDSVLYGSTSSITRSYAPVSLSQGLHTWYVRAYDYCGASTQSASRTFTNAPCVPGVSETCAGPTAGRCVPGVHTCLAGGTWDSCAGQILPASETCNGVDDDCDGQTDEALASCCANGTTRSCYTGAGETAGVGACKAGTQACSNNAWSACAGQTLPGTETCNGLDDDCDGQTDEVLCDAGAFDALADAAGGADGSADAGGPDGSAADGGSPDAGSADGSSADGRSADGGADGSIGLLGSGGGGCGCSTGADVRGAWLLVLVGLCLLRRRR